MWILGLNTPPAGWHDTAACLIDGEGRVVAFSEQERHSRVRHAIAEEGSQPVDAVAYCLAEAGITLRDVDVVAVGWDDRQLFPGRFADDRHFLEEALGSSFDAGRIPELVRVPHHRAHAASSFYASPFTKAAVLVADGNGENESTTIWTFADGSEPVLHQSWPRTASLGYAYNAASVWLGFNHLNAGKTMGLAAYGRARGLEVDRLAKVGGGDYQLAVAPLAERPGRSTDDDLGRDYQRMLLTWREVYSHVAGAEGPSMPLERLHEDPAAVLVAYTAQRIVEDVMGELSSAARQAAGVEELCLAGGIALNCSANGQLSGPVFVPPVPHDAGVALGAAWTVRPPVRREGPISPYLGVAIGGTGDRVPEQDTSGLARSEASVERVTDLLLDHRVGAVAQGRAEVGPRALCHRSIIALPDTTDVHTRVNRIKDREQWRPFAGVTRPDYGSRLWERQEHLNRYMLGAARATAHADAVAPGVVHVDGTTRPQVLEGDEAPMAGAVLDRLSASGHPAVLLNTSFNGRGEPIVNTSFDALRAFRKMDLDFLVLGDVLYEKRNR
ncbi:carbamoyltransferase C-terminal domain-containing protein [Streptomyces sp. NPDC085529]|uniref:carbamoyltransferase C-terminal domain-containing protein n=1 Tax=Streptomyces sp. NPDC085529 TaxID=3365729 RepID=UPI0037D83A82